MSLDDLGPGEPILHLSMPVRDLEEARRFYVDVLGCEPGRVHGPVRSTSSSSAAS